MVKEKLAPIKSVGLLTDDNDYIDVDIPFSESNSKAIQKKIKQLLTSPDGLEIIDKQSERDEIKTIAGIRSRLKKQGTSADEYIDFLFDKGIIDEISDYTASLFKGYFLSKRYLRKADHLLNGHKFDTSFLSVYDLGRINFGNVESIKLTKEKVSFGKDVYGIEIRLDGITDETSQQEKANIKEMKDFGIYDRFTIYQLDLVRQKPKSIQFDFDYTAICNAIIEVIINYMYNKESLDDSIYRDNLIQINQIKAIAEDSSKTEEMFGCQGFSIESAMSDTDHNNNALRVVDEDGNTKAIIHCREKYGTDDRYYSLVSCTLHDTGWGYGLLYRSERIPNGNVMKFRALLDKDKDVRDQLIDISYDVQEVVQGSMDIADSLENTSCFDNHDGIIQACRESWETVGELFNRILEYLEDNKNEIIIKTKANEQE